MVLSDRIQNGDVGTPDMQVVAYGLLLRLGILYLELVDPNRSDIGKADVAVTEAEAWLMRGKINSGDKVSADAQFGIHLLRKLYRLLLDFDAELDGLPVAETDGPAMNTWEKNALKVWTDKENPGDLQPA